MNITRPVASIMRRRSGNESDARESSGNVAASKIIAGEITMPNMLRGRAVPSHDCRTGERRKHQYLDKGLRCDHKREGRESALHAEGVREAASSRALLTLISSRRAAIVPANRIETPPTACIKITSVSPPPKRKAIAVATSVIALPTIFDKCIDIHSVPAAKGTSERARIAWMEFRHIMANSVNTTIWPLYPRASAMATANGRGEDDCCEPN